MLQACCRVVGLAGVLSILLAVGAAGAGAQQLGSRLELAAMDDPASPLRSGLVELCGRSLGGRCSKGRAACSRGTSEDCEAWQRWSTGCNTCADGFMRCRSKVGKVSTATCDQCVTEHDACEDRIRVTPRD